MASRLQDISAIFNEIELINISNEKCVGQNDFNLFMEAERKERSLWRQFFTMDIQTMPRGERHCQPTWEILVPLARASLVEMVEGSQVS